MLSLELGSHNTIGLHKVENKSIMKEATRITEQQFCFDYPLITEPFLLLVFQIMNNSLFFVLTNGRSEKDELRHSMIKIPFVFASKM